MFKELLIYICKDENGDWQFIAFFHWLLALSCWRIVAAHLRDCHGEVTLSRRDFEAIASDFIGDIRAFFATEEGQAEFAAWKAEREKNAVKTPEASCKSGGKKGKAS